MQETSNLKKRLLLTAVVLMGLTALIISQITNPSHELTSGQDQKAVASSQGTSSGELANGRTNNNLYGALQSDLDETPAKAVGIVISPLGEPILEALVLAVPINQSSREPQQATTEDNGTFSFSKLPPGTYKFSATAPGYAAVSSREVALKAGQQRDDLKIQLSAEGFTLSGIVEDSGGGPIPNAKINANLGWNDTTFRTQTDENGYYRLTLLPGGYRIKAQAEMYGSESQRLQLSDERSLDFKLTPAASIYGRVTRRANSKGIPKATVRLHDTQAWQWQQRTVITNEKGFFEFVNIDPGNYQLSAQKGNLYGTHKNQIALTVASSKGDITIAMDTGFSLSGRVKDLSGRGIAKASIVARDKSLRSSRMEVFSNTDGSYQIQGLPPGRYSLRAKAEGYSNERINELSIIDQNIGPIDVTLKEGVQISGRLETESGDPVVGAVVRGTPNGGFWFLLGYDEDQSQEDGSFHLKNLPSGDIKVRATHMLKGGTSEILEDLAPGEHRKGVRLTVKTGTKVTGIVTWDDGTPADGVLVYARDTKRGRGGRAPETIVDQNGSFTLSPLWESQFQIWATTRVATGWRPYPGSMGSPAATVSLNADNPLGTVALVIESPDQFIQGVVVDPEGNPLADCQVGATRELDGQKKRQRWRQSLGEETTQTNVDGTFILNNLPRGNYTLEAKHPNYPAAKNQNIAAGTTDFVFQIKQGASLAGVVKRGNDPVASYDITASTNNQVMRHHIRLPGAKVSDPSGAFLIQGLPADQYTLTVETSDGSAGRLESINLANGEAKTGLVVRLDDGVELFGKLVNHTTGEPLVGVQIFAASPGGRYSAQSDEEGSFSLTGIAQGSSVQLYVAADRSLYIPDAYKYNANQAQTNLGTLRILPFTPEGEDDLPLPIEFKTEDGITVTQTYNEASGILMGDTLVSVNGSPIQGLGKRGLLTLTKGPVGHQTTLSLLRVGKNEPYTVTITHEPAAVSDASP